MTEPVLVQPNHTFLHFFPLPPRSVPCSLTLGERRGTQTPTFGRALASRGHNHVWHVTEEGNDGMTSVPISNRLCDFLPPLGLSFPI